MKRLAALIVSALVLVSGSTFAEDHIVTQGGKKFSPAVLNISAGDTVTFVNDDKSRHNVYSKTDGVNIKIKKKKPGDRDTVTIDHVGSIDIRCAIHPKMKMVINITE